MVVKGSLDFERGVAQVQASRAGVVVKCSFHLSYCYLLCIMVGNGNLDFKHGAAQVLPV